MDYSELSRDRLVQIVEALEKQVEMAEQQKEEAVSKAKKVKADFENYKKREEDRKENWKHQAREELAEDLIAVMDNLERAIASAEQDSAIVQGVKMVVDQLYDALEKRGLERIDAEGEEFDPKIHNAVETRDHEEEDKVLEMIRHGYMYNDRVLREAEVVVGKKAEN
ncbi:MAG: nucleotide exchange factor GrpE [Candidatus Nanohaloarchaea archaeon]|nr:nucleotide exchange factor GrpE [Candidatus Nanohaloarchaea archaeon]